MNLFTAMKPSQFHWLISDALCIESTYTIFYNLIPVMKTGVAFIMVSLLSPYKRFVSLLF